uniref:Immunoglobulin subtype domain-containing protein n=1 Tax=Lepisosteus oculatus TaxID=7918 RepID=W5MPQ2_LEPOC
MDLGSKSRNRSVLQKPASVPVLTGDDVTLQCTIHTEICAGEQNVYCFRHGSEESLPGIIFTHENRSDKCERSSEAQLPTQCCDYYLPKKNIRHSDSGTTIGTLLCCGHMWGDPVWKWDNARDYR